MNLPRKNKSYIIKNISCSLLLFFVFLTPVSAANLQDAFKISDGKNDDPLDAAAHSAGYDTSLTSPEPIIAAIIQALLSFLGIIFLVLMIYGGYLWMTDRGNEQQVEKAKNIITAAIIGLIIVLAAYAISYFVVSNVSKGTLSSG